jgi:triacylglycerol esterase/lipase EstA (alpha/beta hydrolase family)
LIAAGWFDRASLWLLARRLRQRGWRTLFPAPRRWPEQRAAVCDAIDACVQRARASSPEEPLVLVAHAVGGLVARDYLRSNPDAPVGMLVTLGTPHQETLAPPFRIRSLHGTGGNEIRELANADPVPDRFDVVAISADFDAWVVPPGAAYYPRAFNVSVAMLGHFGLLVSRKVYGLVLENIEAAPLPQAVRPASTAPSTRATSSSSL